MDTSLVTPTHSFTLPAFVLVFSLPFPYPRVCEIGVVVAVVCLIRSVLLIGGYYTYSNLFCLVSRVLFHPVCHAVCAPSVDSSKPTTTPSHLDTRLCSFLFCFYLVRTRNHSRFSFRFRPLLSFIDRSYFPICRPTSTSPVLGLVWSATSTSSPFLPRTYVLCTTT